MSSSGAILVVFNRSFWTFLYETSRKVQPGMFCTAGNGCEWDWYQTHFTTEEFTKLNRYHDYSGLLSQWLLKTQRARCRESLPFFLRIPLVWVGKLGKSCAGIADRKIWQLFTNYLFFCFSFLHEEVNNYLRGLNITKVIPHFITSSSSETTSC